MEKKPYVIGLDLGGTNSEFGIVDQNANIIASTRVKTAGHGNDPNQYVDDCVAALRPIIEQVGGIEKIHAMGPSVTTTAVLSSSPPTSRGRARFLSHRCSRSVWVFPCA